MIIDNTDGKPIGAIRCNGDLIVIAARRSRVYLRGSVITGALYVLTPVGAGTFKSVAVVSDKAQPILYPRNSLGFFTHITIDVSYATIGFGPEGAKTTPCVPVN